MACAECGATSPDGAKFCFNCGARLESPRPPEGDRRFITVLFADVVDSTAMGESVDPETIAEIMNGAFAFFNASVARYGGTVSRLMGDAVLAIFGAPVAHEDDAERAVHVGLAILSAAERYAEHVRRRHGFDFRVRVGINSGKAVLAMVGDDIKMEYTAMGDTANLASRLQNSADPGTLLISAETHSLVRKIFETRAMGPVPVKGRAEPLEVFQVLGVKAQPGSVRGLDGLQSPLVGRDDEMAAAHSALASKRDTGAIVVITGEAGLGKSRMVAELRTWARELPAPPLWLEGRALSYGQTIAYYPWRQIVRRAAGIDDETPADEVRERLAASVPPDDLMSLERLLSLESEGADDDDSPSGQDLVRRIGEAVARLLTASTEGSAVVVLDDLHWADEASLDLLSSMAEVTKSYPLVLVTITRPDREAKIVHTLERIRNAHAGHLTEITLQPLTDDASETLLANLLQIEGMPDGLREKILDRSEGNPFFIEEVIRWLIDSGHIVQEGDGWRVSGAEIGAVAIPETLAGLLASRIDRLPPETKRVVQAAAVIGRIFEYPLLERVCERDRIANPEPHVRELTAEELIREKNPLVEYIFKHALTQEAAMDLLLLRRRREYHELVGNTMEELYPDRLDELAGMLAYHFGEAENWDRAATYAHRAGFNDIRVYAVHEAIEHFNLEYEALSRLDAPAPERVIDAVTSWVEYGWKELMIHQKQYPLLVERLQHAEGLARRLGDRNRLALVLSWLGNTHASAGFPGRGVQAIHEAFELVDASDDPRLTIMPLFVMTSSKVDQSPREAIPALADFVGFALRAGRDDVAAHALANKALAHARIGEFAEAERTLARALELAAETDVPVKRADVHSVASLVSLDMGDVQTGLEYARQAVDEAAGAGAGDCTVYALYCVGQSHLRKPDVESARRSFDEATERTEGLQSDYLTYLGQSGKAIAEAMSDDGEAVAVLETARTQARAFGDIYTEAQMSQTLAEHFLRVGDLDRAGECLGSALAYYRGNDMLPYLVRSVSLLAILAEKRGAAADAAAANAELEVLTERLNRALQERDEILAAV